MISISDKRAERSPISGPFKMLSGSCDVSEMDVWAIPTEVAVAILRDCLSTVSCVRLRVNGSCMLPTLPPGASVVISQTRRCPPRIGDVVLVHQPAGLRLHRVFWGPPLSLGRRRWLTRADQGPDWDAWVSSEVLLGTVTGVEGRPGLEIRLRQWPLVRFLFVGLLRGLRARLKERRLRP